MLLLGGGSKCVTLKMALTRAKLNQTKRDEQRRERELFGQRTASPRRASGKMSQRDDEPARTTAARVRGARSHQRVLKEGPAGTKEGSQQGLENPEPIPRFYGRGKDTWHREQPQSEGIYERGTGYHEGIGGESR